jgi:uncharacterized membrane protein YcaP (DUF421 family)
MDVDWTRIFVPKFPVAETILRSVFAFFVLLFLARLFRRDFGKVGTSDVLVILLLASAIRNVMAYDGSDPSVTTAFLSVVTLLILAHAVNWFATRFPFVRKFIYADRVVLVKDGRIYYRNLRDMLMTEGDLHAKLREKGLADPRQVLAMYLEGDGKVTIIKRPK